MANLLKNALCASSRLAWLATVWSMPATAQSMPPIAQAPAAPAQPATVEVGDIVVTAQRREQKLQDVGISVAAYSGDRLREQGITASTDIAKITPGVSLSGSAGGQGLQFSIRGVTQSDFNDAIESPTAVYVDDSYIASQQGQGLAMFDMERIEILKGPQGTLFGRNATGGLVNFIVAKPKPGDFGGYIDGTYGSFDRTTLEGAWNIPLSSTLTVRASGIWDRHGPIWHNLSPAGLTPGAPVNFGTPNPNIEGGQDLGDDDKLAGRLQILFKPTDDLAIRLTGSALRENLSTSPFSSASVEPVLDAQGRVVGEQYASPTETRAAIGPGGVNVFDPSILPFQAFLYSPNNDGHRVPGANYFGSVPVNPDNRDISENYALGDLNRFRAYNGALHIDATLGSVKLASVTSYSRYTKQFLLDADVSPVNAFVYGSRSRTSSLTQELRLSGESNSFSWTAGAYYLHIHAFAAQGLLAPQGSALALVLGVPDTGIDPLSVANLTTDSLSGFGQVAWKFASKFTIVAGARVVHEHQKYHFASYATANANDYAVDLGAPLFQLQPSFQDRRTEILWAGKLQLEYRPRSGLLLYAGVNRGVKGGSYNSKLFDGTPPLTPDQIPYKPEVLVSYEGGVKWSSPDNRLTIDAAVYHYDYHNYQSFVFNNLSGAVQNVNARTNGAEIAASLRVIRGLRVGVTGAITDAKVKDLAIAPGVLRDTRPAYTPKYMGSAQIDYTVPGSVLGGQLQVGAVESYQSSISHNARDFAADRFAGYALLDFHVDLSFPSGLSLGGYLKNALDKRYETIGIDLATACGCNADAYGNPREFGLKAGYKF